MQLGEIAGALQSNQVNNEAVQKAQRTVEYLAAQLQEMSLALQTSQVDKETLQASQLANKKLTAELAKLEERIPAPGVSTPRSLVLCSL